MLKYSLILIGIYVLYYGGNIVYDLFLKKRKQPLPMKEFSLVSFAKTESPPESRIEIDDVENIELRNPFRRFILHYLSIHRKFSNHLIWKK
jgi:hypothetical protein